LGVSGKGKIENKNKKIVKSESQHHQLYRTVPNLPLFFFQGEGNERGEVWDIDLLM
jgi:hypothetical protein